MPQQAQTIVSKPQRLGKQKLHALIMQGWTRAIAKAGGKGSFADALDVSTVAIDKHLTGSMPGLDMIDAALEVEATILDDWLAAKGKRIVDKEAVCDRDDASVLVARLMLWLQEAQHPESAGGRKIVHTELLPAELLIRQLHGATGNWLARISDMKNAA